MKAAADVAHRAGKRIAIHSYGPDGARDAVRAGADSVEHATDMDDATIAEMARRGTVYVPTVDHNRYYIAHREEYGYDQAVADRLNDYIKRNLETLKRAVRGRVTIAMGSDAVFTGFGENTRELEWFVKAGMTPGQALAAATSNGAALLGMSKDLGAVAPGRYADIVAVEGDPLRDIGSVINGVRWVMKGGAVVVDRRPAIDRSRSEARQDGRSDAQEQSGAPRDTPSIASRSPAAEDASDARKVVIPAAVAETRPEGRRQVQFFPARAS